MSSQTTFPIDCKFLNNATITKATKADLQPKLSQNPNSRRDQTQRKNILNPFEHCIVTVTVEPVKTITVDVIEKDSSAAKCVDA